jgi:hypothetical protein
MIRQRISPGVLPHGGLIARETSGGGLIRVIPKLTYSVQPDRFATHDVVLAKYIETSLWVSGVALTRVFAKSFNDDGQSFAVSLSATSYEEENPDIDMLEATAGTQVTISNVTVATAPRLLVTQIATSIAGQLRVVLTANQSISGAAFSVTLGVDIIGRRS